MLDIEQLLADPAGVKGALARKKFANLAWIDEAGALATRRRVLITEAENLKAEKNRLSDEFGARRKANQPADDLTARINEIDSEIPAREKLAAEADDALRAIMLQLPNLPDADVPDGGEEANREVSRWGTKPEFAFTPKPHEEIGESLGILDFQRGAKLSGARFTVLVGPGAKLERALVNFMLETHTGSHGYTEIFPPLLVKRSTPMATGHLPKAGDQMFVAFPGNELDETKEQKEFLPADPDAGRSQYYLVPTAELPLTGLHADEIFPADQLPVNYAAFTPCFRSEAGSYGRDVKGMLRQHQFQKVELYAITHPEQSNAVHEALTGHAEKILQLLGLHYRKVLLAAGDMGFAARRTYDLEVWLPSQNAFREISSCSNCGDFQARRAKIRFRDESKKNRLVHTLNGSGLAVGRTALAILEQYQQPDGSVIIPEALRPFFGADAIRGR